MLTKKKGQSIAGVQDIPYFVHLDQRAINFFLI